MVRTALYEAAHVMLTRSDKFSALKRWALEVAKRRVIYTLLTLGADMLNAVLDPRLRAS